MSGIAEALFRVPPFPGAKPVRIVTDASPPHPVPEGAVQALVAAIRQERVGGAFWGVDDPWARFASGAVQHVDGNDPLALLAAIAGCAVVCGGGGTFAALSGAEPGAALHALVAEHLVARVTWHDPFMGTPTTPLAIVRRMGAWRRLIESNRAIGAAYGFAGWKQDTVAGLLWDGTDASPFAPATPAHLDQLPPDAAVAVWKARVPADFLALVERSGRTVVEVEDGFIRSIGLGADCVPPLSIVLDDLGAHYDPSKPSRLEILLSQGAPDAMTLTRARALAEAIAASGISKYGVAEPPFLVPQATGTIYSSSARWRMTVLSCWGAEALRPTGNFCAGCGNAAPMPSSSTVRIRTSEAGHRKGHVPTADALSLADRIDPGSAISDLIAMVDEVHVLTSLAGFESLLRRKKVVTHGVPFYAGWGLTTDLGPVPTRRQRKLDLDQLVAAVLIDYPRYIDPVTNLPSDVELLIARMGAGVRRENGALVALRRSWGRFTRIWTRVRK